MEKNHEIELIEFNLPKGRSSKSIVKTSKEVWEKYTELCHAGCRLTAEILSTDEISQCIEDENGDYDIILCTSIVEAQGKLEEMILRFNLKEFEGHLNDH